MAKGDLGTLLQCSFHDPPDGETAEIVRGVEVGDKGLQGGGRIAARWGNGLHDCIEQRSQVCIFAGRPIPIIACPDRATVEMMGKSMVWSLASQVEEQLVDLVGHFLGSGVGTVDLVDHDHRREMQGQGLGEDVAGLGHRAVGGVDQEEDPVDHGQGPLHLTSEVGMTGRVHQVDPGVAPLDGSRLGQDRDPAFPFLIGGVHDPVDSLLV